MKHCFFFAFILLAFAPRESSAQLAFGVSPGLQMNGAYVGYKFNDRLMGTFSFQYYGVSSKIDDSGDETKFSAALIVPSVGIKYFLPRQNQIQPYLTLNLSKPIVSGKLEYDGEPDEEFEDAIDNLSLLGVGFGFGVEYFFDENFSLGGEYGFQFLSAKYDISDEFDDIEFTGSFNPTYTKLTLNYYFGGGE